MSGRRAKALRKNALKYVTEVMGASGESKIVYFNKQRIWEADSVVAVYRTLKKIYRETGRTI